MIDRLSELRRRISPALREATQTDQFDEVRRAIGHLQAKTALTLYAPTTLHDTEFSVFSQWGEDGIIQYLTRMVPIATRSFVEIGVADYRESNTRFLLTANNWRGLIVNGGTKHQEFVRSSELGWRYGIDAVSAFVTAENVDGILLDAGVEGDLGLLSVDIDGVDYWVWKAISVVSPRIFVCEFNSVFGPTAAVTVPYDPAFSVYDAHHSGQYFGTSLTALHRLATEKGYQLVGVNSHGINAFFVRRDVGQGLWDLTPQEAYVRTQIRTARDVEGHLTWESDHLESLRLVRDKMLWDVDAGALRTVAAVYGV